jgi:hypothetical protein
MPAESILPSFYSIYLPVFTSNFLAFSYIVIFLTIPVKIYIKMPMKMPLKIPIDMLTALESGLAKTGPNYNRSGLISKKSSLFNSTRNII